MTGAAPSWPGLLTTLLAGESIGADDTTWAMNQVMGGDATSAQIAAFVVALRAKGVTSEEMAGLVAAMLAHAGRISVDGPAVDTCGTGGDRAHTVNISTMAALVAAGAGATVVKHGNRAASSSTGSADVLEELGVVIDLPPSAVQECVAKAGIGFCFAPVFHPALRHAGATRRELGIPTVFNFLGPLTNPAEPSAQVVGVPDPRMAPVMAGVLARRGTSALVFRGDDGLDELSTATTSQVWVVRGGSVTERSFDPADLGVARSAPGALTGGERAHNADVVRRVLGGQAGPVRDAVLLNAAAALVAVRPGPDPVADLVGEFAAALVDVTAALDDGRAAAALERWVEVSRGLAAESG